MTCPGVSKPGGAVLHSPWLDLSLTEASISPYAAVDLTISAAFMRLTLVPAYTGEKIDAADSRVSPLFSQSLTSLSPQLVLWGAAEVLQCDARAWVARCEAAGVGVTSYAAPCGLHCRTMGGLAGTWQTRREADTILIAWLVSQRGHVKQA